MPRVILITGTRKGIGRDLSEYYLNKGDIVCGCSRTQSNLEHKNYRHFTLDVSDENAVVNMVRAVKKEFGTIDVLLNNAGIASMNHILTTPLKTMQNIFNTNVFGSFLFLREVSKVMVQNYKKRVKDLESKGLDSKNNAKNAIAEAVCDDFKESAILDSNNKDSTAEGFLSDFSGFGAKGEGSLLNINDRALSEQKLKSTTCAKHQSKPAKETKHKITAFIGDGINDSIVLKQADIGISIGTKDSHSDISKESADIILTNPSPMGIVHAIKIARKIQTLTWQNITFALGTKLILVLLGIAGIANMWLAVFGDVGVALLALLNALRVVRV